MKRKLLILIPVMVLLVLTGCDVYANKENIDKICSQNITDKIDYLYFNESQTESMYPTINKTSIAYIEKVDDIELQIGDIILFKVSESRGCYWVHRIISIKEDSKGIYYVTKGDNNFFSDFFQKTRKDDVYYRITQIK